MAVTIESVRFGEMEVSDEALIDFPFGLIGLGGSRYALIDRNPGSGFQWLHSVEDPTLALPVVDPATFFPDFTLTIAPEDLERTGIECVSDAHLYVTVRATPNPLEITANLRAPLVVVDRRGYQVLNGASGASLRAPLFTLADEDTEPSQAVDAA